MTREREQELVLLAAAGDRAAAAELVRAHQERLVAFLLRMTGRRDTAEDVAQEAFVRALRSLPRFDPQYRFSTWLFTIARHKIVEKLRYHMRDRRDMRRDEGLDHGTATAILSAYQTNTTPSQIAESREQVAKLEQAIDLLEPDHREVVTLVRLAGLPYAEVAQIIGRTPEATRMLLGRALIKLAAALRQVGLRDDTHPPA